jgi:DNA-binding transcriptional regulator YiaG
MTMPNKKRVEPTPEEIRSARESAGLTQAQAGKLVFSPYRTWQQWEAGERRMHAATWQLFRLKVILNEGIGDEGDNAV